MSCIQHDGIVTSIKVSSFWYKNDPYVLASQAKQVFYLNDPKLGLNWRVVQQFQHRHIYDENEVGSILDDKDVESHIVEAIIVPFERIEAEEDFVISDDEDESPIEYDRYEMAPGQSKKRSKFSSTAEVTNGISLTTNTKVMGSTTFLPRSNLEVNNTQYIDQLNQSMSSSLSPDATPNTDGGLSKKKPCRGPTRGFGLVKRNEVAGKKLQVVVDVEHGRPLNRIESAKLSNELGQIVRDYMPCPIKYSNYTKEEKNCAWERLLVFQCVENILKVRYRNYKHALHNEFLKYNSATEAKLHVPKGLTTENWNELCDYWSKGDNISPLRDVDENEEQPRQRERDQPLIPPPHVGQYQERDPYYEQPNDRAGFYEREDQFEPRRRNAPRENFFDQRGREVLRDDYYEPRRMNAPRENYRAPTQRIGNYPPRDEPPRESFEEKMLRMMTEIKQDMGHMRQEWKQDIRHEVSAVRQSVSNYRQESTSSIRNLENQMAQVTKAERPRGALPSTIENNPRERVQAITLRSGKELPDPVLHKSSTSKSPIEEENVKNFELVDNNLVGCVNDESLDFDEFDNVDACACDAISAVENDNAACDMNGEVEG
nr:uncharacterized protein LOC109154451 [Ipomoea trifida]